MWAYISSNARCRPFFLMGESYGGVYVPTFTDLLLKGIVVSRIIEFSFDYEIFQKGEIKDIDFQGIAIGNGELSTIQQVGDDSTNSFILMNLFRSTPLFPSPTSEESTERSKHFFPIFFPTSPFSRDYDKLAQCATDADGPMSYYDWTKSVSVSYFSKRIILYLFNSGTSPSTIRATLIQRIPTVRPSKDTAAWRWSDRDSRTFGSLGE